MATLFIVGFLFAIALYPNKRKPVNKKKLYAERIATAHKIMEGKNGTIN